MLLVVDVIRWTLASLMLGFFVFVVGWFEEGMGRGRVVAMVL